MNAKRYTPLALTLALAVGAAAPGFAQATDNPRAGEASGDVVLMDSFEVTAGFASSLAAAAQVKQEQKIIAEVIASEDIGKLPDISIADALTRLTGLTTQRTNGRSQAISIRGLSGDFSTGLLNGREQVSTGLNRAVEYDQYPADLLNSVVVYKTAESGLIGQGLAGTIDLQTIRPLSKSGRIVAMNGYYEWNELGQLTPGVDDTGRRFSVSYVDQNADGTLGIAVGLSHSRKPFAGEQFQAWGYPTDANGNFGLGGTKSYVRNSVLDRDGVMATLEFRPNSNVHTSIDLFASKFGERQLLRGMEIPLIWSGAAFQGTPTAEDGLLVDATMTNVQPVVRNDVFDREADPISIGWNLVLGADSAWPVTFDASYSRVTRDDLNLETWSGLGLRGNAATPDTMRIQLMPGQVPVITPGFNYADGAVLRLTDPQGWGPDTLPGNGMYGYMKGFRSKDELGQLQLSTRHEREGLFTALTVGASYTDRYKRDGEDPSGYLHTPNGELTLPLPPKVGTTDMSFLGIGEIYAYDPLAALDAGVWGFRANTDTGIVANRFRIREKVTQVHSQGEFERKLGGDVNLTGNLGVRVIHTDQSSEGRSANGNSLNEVTDGDTYTDVSPSLNLSLDFGNNLYLRFSAARQVARPRMYDMRASRSWGFDATKVDSTDSSQSPWSGGGGNSRLRPWKSDSLDLSLEKYFKENRGYVAVAAFNKDLKNYIYEQQDVADFSSYPVPGGVTPTLDFGLISQPVNGEGGNVRGLEFTLSLASELLNPDLRGFGLVLGGAYTDSSVQPWGPTGPDAPIAGLSRHVTNTTVYYERQGFSARVSHRYRSENRQYITTFGPPNPGGDVNPNGGFSVAQPESVVDAQLSYTFQEGAARGLSFFLQAYNLTNEPLITYNNDDARQVINYQTYGASYSLGFAYRF